MALEKTLLKKRFKDRHPLPPKAYFCDKTIGSRELIFWTIPIKKCMNNLDFFQPNLRRSSESHCPVWRGMTPIGEAHCATVGGDGHSMFYMSPCVCVCTIHTPPILVHFHFRQQRK